MSNCFGGGNSLKKVYFGNQDNIVLGSAVFGNDPSLDVIDLSEVKNVEMVSEPGYDNRITNFYGTAGITMVYVANESVYQTINEVTFDSTIASDNGKKVTKSGFDNSHNIVAITNGGTFVDKPTSNAALAVPSKTGYTFDGWYSSSNFAEGTKLNDNNHPVIGKTYYAKWTEKATPAIAIKATPSTLTGGGSVELTVSGVPTEGKLAVTCDNDIKVNEKDGKYTAALPNETKDYTFKADYTGTDLYNNASDTCVVSVTYKGSSHHSSSSSSSSTSNTVSASTASNGKVSLDKSTAKKGNTVTVTVTPDAGYQLDKLTVTDAKGKTVDVTKKSDGKYTFTMPDSKVTITPTFSKIEDTKPSKNGFDDVASSDWFADAVKYVSDKGLMSGTGSDKFAPSATTTRAMLMTVLARYAGEDTTGGATWYEKSMEWAKSKGVSDGTNPNANITREQLVTMMYRYAGSPKADGKLDSFSDAASVSTYAADAMQWAVANGIVNGSNGKLSPQNNATRAEVAAILMRFCEISK